MIETAHIHDATTHQRLGFASLEIGCGDAWCDSCGDCMHCYGGDDGCPAGSHWWVIYEDDLAEWFGVELTPPPARPPA